MQKRSQKKDELAFTDSLEQINVENIVEIRRIAYTDSLEQIYVEKIVEKRRIGVYRLSGAD